MKYIIALILITSITVTPQNLFKLKNESTSLNKSYNDQKLIFSNPVEKKKTGLAIIYSLLLPGMGELYAGNYQSGKYFTIAEAAIWTTFVGMNTYAGWLKNDYKNYAKTNGGVNNTDKDDRFYSTIADYQNIDEYNNEKAINREFDQMYDKNTNYWSWENTTQRRTFRNLRVKSEQTYNDLRFVVAAAIINRLLSVIDAVRSVSQYNKNLPVETGWNISAGLTSFNNSPNLLLNFSTNF